MPQGILKAEVEAIVRKEIEAYDRRLSLKLFIYTILVAGLGFGAGWMTYHWRQVRRGFKATAMRWASDCQNFFESFQQ